jgi:uncharacterized membrane protein
MAASAPQPTPASSRLPWAKIILALSLGLNLLFLGLAGGAFLRDGPPGRNNSVRDLNFGPMTEALTGEDRESLRRSFQRAAPDLREHRRDTQNDLGELLTVLRAADFERAKVEALFARNNERAAQRQKLGQNLMLDLLVAMTTDARHEFADRLEMAMKHDKKPGNP